MAYYSFSYTQSVITKAYEWINAKISSIYSGVKTPEPVIYNTVTIGELTSQRYLYTLIKEIEKKFPEQSGSGITLEPSFDIFTKIYNHEYSFVFEIQWQKLEFDKKSYFFDIWNRPHISVVSGEIRKTVSWESWVIALTFDDGPSPKYTNTLLKILAKENVKATFFVLGSRAHEYPNIVKQVHAEWHEIGSHGYSHKLITKLTHREMLDEIYNTDMAIYGAIGKHPDIFRPPYWGINTGVLDKISMPAILWSIDTRDWEHHNKNKTIASIKSAKNWDIIIMHDIHETSVDSVSEMISILKKKWFRFVTISELLWINENNTEIGKICRKKGNCK